jgi:DNA-repair protein XRCC1
MKRGMRRNRDALLYDEEDDAPNEKLDKKLKLEQEKRDKEQQEESAKKKQKKSPEKKK